MLRALLLAERDERAASSRCRVFQYVEPLRAHGVEARVVAGMPPWSELWRAGEADVVLVQKRALPASRLAMLRARARAVVFDLDDATWLRRDARERIRPARRWRRIRLEGTVRLADGLAAGNQYLADWMRGLNRVATLAVIPTPIDPARYAGVAGGGGLRVGWVGGRDNLRSLKLVEPALARLAKRHPGLTLRVVSSEPFRTDAIAVENVPWRLEEEGAAFRAVDVGLMPLTDDPWTRGKCSYKALQFMAAGVPVVCSDVGMNREVVREGETGFLCADDAAWERAIEALLASPALRKRVGEAGRAFVAREYSLDGMAAKLAALLRDVAERGRAA